MGDLRWNQCRCPTCGERFRSVAGFDMHRTGKHGVNRRCRTVAEMEARGMSRNPTGFWLTEARGPLTVTSGKRKGAEIASNEYPPSGPPEKAAPSTQARL